MKRYLTILLLLAFHVAPAQKAETVLLRNPNQQLPLGELRDVRTAVLHFGDEQAAVFDSIAQKYQPITSFMLTRLPRSYMTS
ncbi:hypothetical protein MKQ70_19770 [Chitinophaga sedimenti]|uniref:hypothetical protein n=1 Tax=Chitinophaga sedimenti TaxID=2033606 RepID=UPI00200303E6|nr:hypothetical protein [Chitinophaga sedimenti]MCK7557120.1 hypothetical protein [Chitinophaga sedimenti]